MAPGGDGPITGICIVADPERCPPGYELIYRSHDKKDDCDLWKDGFFRSRITRYLCITRVFPLDGGKLNNVLADIVIYGDREVPYQGFTLLDKTQDTGEQATKKKTVGVKMVHRNSANNAICDLIILSKSKRAPPGYTLIGGDINGLAICYKSGEVPADTKNLPNLPSSSSFDASTSNRFLGRSNSQPGHVHNEINTAPVTRQESASSTGGSNPIHDVPFQLNASFQDSQSLSQAVFPTISIKSLSEIDSEFSYPFRLERSAVSAT